MLLKYRWTDGVGTMKSKATLPKLNYDNCKDCASKCEHAGKNREFVYSGERSCKVNGIARKIDREKWEPCMWCALNGQFGLNSYCSACGRPLTEEAWAELERRAFGEV